VPGLVAGVQPQIAACGPTFAALATVVPPMQFWRYKDMWTFSLRNAVFAVLLVRFLSDHTLASLEDVSAALASVCFCFSVLCFLLKAWVD
jgi:hypothetical protein